MKNSKHQQNRQLQQNYQERYPILTEIAASLQGLVTDYLIGQARIDRITARAKDIESFLAKANKKEKNRQKYAYPLTQIQDQVGVRIVTFFKSDVESLDTVVKRYFRPVEFRDHVPDSEWEFGYFGRHYVLIMPPDVIGCGISKDMVPSFFELQIKTLFQHAWSEAEHDLGYKPGQVPLTPDQNRQLAFTSAQAWGADHAFDELFRHRQDLDKDSNMANTVSS